MSNITLNSPLTSSKSITAPSFKGSLFGTASWAQTASYVDLVAGPGIIIDSVNGLAISASVRSVNGIFPIDGNISTTLTAVITGPSASLEASSSGDITGSFTEGTVWVISNDPDANIEGESYIYDLEDTTNEGVWLKLSSNSLATNDARYLMLTPQAPISGNLDMGGFEINNGDLIGTSSWSQQSILAQTASYFLTSSVTSASLAQTASHIKVTGSNIIVNWNGDLLELTGSTGGAGSSVYISSSSPDGVATGSLWWNEVDGNTYVYVSQSTWVPANSNVAYSDTASIALTASYFLTSSVTSASIAENVTPYILTAYSSASYTLPGGFTNDPCRYNVVDTLLNVPAGWFNTTTYRFTPQKAGYWRITAVYDIFRASNVEAALSITKNGVQQTGVGGFGAVAVETSRIIYLNGTTDYVAAINSGGAAALRNQFEKRSYFEAEFISA